MYWHFASEVIGPVVAALSKANEAMKEKIKSEIFALIDQKYPDGNVVIDSCAIVLYGEK